MTYSDHSVYSYEAYDETVLDEVSTDFYLVNTVVQEAGHISSIEIYGHIEGDITLHVTIKYSYSHLFTFKTNR